jgi:hypothetical protein
MDFLRIGESATLEITEINTAIVNDTKVPITASSTSPEVATITPSDKTPGGMQKFIVQAVSNGTTFLQFMGGSFLKEIALEVAPIGVFSTIVRGTDKSFDELPSGYPNTTNPHIVGSKFRIVVTDIDARLAEITAESTNDVASVEKIDPHNFMVTALKPGAGAVKFKVGATFETTVGFTVPALTNIVVIEVGRVT